MESRAFVVSLIVGILATVTMDIVAGWLSGSALRAGGRAEPVLI